MLIIEMGGQVWELDYSGIVKKIMNNFQVREILEAVVYKEYKMKVQ